MMMNKKTVLLLVSLIGFVLVIGVGSVWGSDWVRPLPITPGAVNPAVTQENIKTTICKSGWTVTVRPSVAYTNKLKATELATTYKGFVALYGSALGNYELDHLISLQLGGNPVDVKNLWVEPYVGQNARKKDVVETALKRLVCAGSMKLHDAQILIASDWVAAFNKYVTPADVKSANGND